MKNYSLTLPIHCILVWLRLLLIIQVFYEILTHHWLRNNVKVRVINPDFWKLFTYPSIGLVTASRLFGDNPGFWETTNLPLPRISNSVKVRRINPGFLEMSHLPFYWISKTFKVIGGSIQAFGKLLILYNLPLPRISNKVKVRGPNRSFSETTYSFLQLRVRVKVGRRSIHWLNF